MEHWSIDDYKNYTNGKKQKRQNIGLTKPL